MSGSLSQLPALTFGTRLRLLAESRGYAGKGAIAFPIMTNDGRGVLNFVVTEEEQANAPLGTVLYNPKSREFQQRVEGDNGAEWSNVGTSPNMDSLTGSEYAEYSNQLHLPPLPAPNPGPGPEPEPEEDLSFLTAPVVTVDTLPSEAARKPGMEVLKHSTGNPATDMVVATNGELELALALRYYRVKQTFGVSDGDSHYNINLDESSFKPADWSWVYSLVLVDVRNGNCITDLYDVRMEVKFLAGNTLEFIGKFDNGVFHFIEEANMLDIVDNTTDGTGSICQNIQRVTFYKEQLGVLEFGVDGAPIGDYSIKLTATRKRGEDLLPVEIHVGAHVFDQAPVPDADDLTNGDEGELQTFSSLTPIEADDNGESESESETFDSTSDETVKEQQEDPGFNSTDPVELDEGAAPAARGEVAPVIHSDSSGHFELPENTDANLEEMELHDDVMVPVEGDIPPTYPCPTCNAGECVPFGGETDTIELDGKSREVTDLSGARCNNCGATFYSDDSLDRRAAAETELLEEAVAEEVGAEHEQPTVEDEAEADESKPAAAE